MPPRHADEADRPSVGMACPSHSYPAFTLGAFSTDAESLPSEPPPATPHAAGDLGRLGKYRIRRELGRGGMGAVYLAFDERLEREVALKVMLPKAAANATARERFLREARAAARISSDHVVGIYEAEEVEGTPYIALQLLRGCPLSERLRKGRLPLRQAVRIAHQTALGLAAAHKLGLVHRDVKPANVWLEAPDGRVKILDFGLAKPAAGPDEGELTGSGVVAGTPSYMSPEQARGEPLDGRADLFSLGVMLYRLVCGKLPFDGPTVTAVLTAIVTEEPTPVTLANPRVPPALADLIHRLLAKDPDDRPASADEVADLLAGTGARAKGRRPAALVAAGLLAAALTLAGFLIIKITHKDGSVTEIKVPDGAKVEVAADPAEGEGDKPGGRKPAVAEADADRRAAEWVLGSGGHVGLAAANGNPYLKGTDAKLPAGPFKVRKVWACSLAVAPSDADMGRLDELTQLEELALTGKLSDAAVVKLSGYPLAKTVCELTVFSDRLTDDALAALAKFTALRDLHVGWSPELTGRGLDRLNGPRLHTLTISRCRLTDEHLAHVNGMPNLEFLNVEQTAVTDAGMKVVGELPNLRQLGLFGVKGVTDAGLKHLKGLSKLTAVDLRKTGVTEAGVKELAAALPKCRVEHDGGVVGPKPSGR